MNKKVSGIVLTVLFFSQALKAETPAKLKALPKAQFENILPAPPKAGEADDLNDLNEVLKLQKTRTQSDCDRAKTELNISPANLFAAPHGPLTAKQIAAIDSFLVDIEQRSDEIVDLVKVKFHRPRPYMSSKAVHPCVPGHPSHSYPSGHSALSFVLAGILGKMDPARAKLYRQRAEQIGYDRVIAGVHYPTDFKAGEKLGDAIVEQWLKDPVVIDEIKRDSQFF